MPKYVALKTVQLTGKDGYPEFVAPGETFDLPAAEGAVLVEMGAAEPVAKEEKKPAKKPAKKQAKKDKEQPAAKGGQGAQDAATDVDPFAVD